MGVISDGYRMRQNFDGEWVFLEGRSNNRKLLTPKEVQSMESCFKRRNVTKMKSRLLHPSYSNSQFWHHSAITSHETF